MCRSRTTWHETVGNAAWFSFSVAVPEESYREGQTSLRAIALLGRPDQQHRHGMGRWWRCSAQADD
jgi:hypothetical protein